MKKNLAFGFSFMLLLSACSNDLKDMGDNAPVTQSRLQHMEFTASTGAGTRTQLTSDNNVVWLAGDGISIFDGIGNRKFTTYDGGASAVFGGKAAVTDTYYALYPYQEGATLKGNSIMNVTIPSEQTAKAGSFDAACNLSVATASSDLQLAFKNVGSLVRFSVSNDQASKVRKVKLTSHDDMVVLTGTVDISLGVEPAPIPASGQQSSVTMIAENGLEADQYYFFVVLPSLLNAGFSLTFYDEDGKTWQIDYPAVVNLARSSILSLNAIEVDAFTNTTHEGFNEANPLIGTWRAEVEEKGEWQYWEMTFDFNYNYSIKEYNKDDNTIIYRSEIGRYDIVRDSNTIIITYSDGDTDTSKFIISDGNKLEFLDFDHDIIYYKIK